jgi:hypothetical protein
MHARKVPATVWMLVKLFISSASVASPLAGLPQCHGYYLVFKRKQRLRGVEEVPDGDFLLDGEGEIDAGPERS